MEKIPMTAAGHAALESELKRRTSQERPRIIEAIAEARGHGDLSENAEYHAAKEQHGHNEGAERFQISGRDTKQLHLSRQSQSLCRLCQSIHRLFGRIVFHG